MWEPGDVCIVIGSHQDREREAIPQQYPLFSLVEVLESYSFGYCGVRILFNSKAPWFRRWYLVPDNHLALPHFQLGQVALDKSVERGSYGTHA